VTSEEGFLRRWARRKATASSGAAPAEEAAAPAPAPLPAAPQESDEEAAQRLGLPEIDSLDPESDFSVFMQAAVPESIRRRALRRLWRIHPVISTPDGLTDYAEDYTDAAVALRGLKTAYRVGLGYLKDAIETTAADAAKPAEPAATQPGDAPDAAPEPQPGPAAAKVVSAANKLPRDSPTRG